MESNQSLDSLLSGNIKLLRWIVGRVLNLKWHDDQIWKGQGDGDGMQPLRVVNVHA